MIDGSKLASHTTTGNRDDAVTGETAPEMDIAAAQMSGQKPEPHLRLFII